MWRKTLSATALVGLLAFSAEAGVIFSNGGPDPNRGWPYSDFDFPAEIADDFVLAPASNVVRDVHWWGRYGSRDVAPASDNFAIRIFADAAGRPAADPLHTAALLAPVTRTLIEDPAGTQWTTYFAYDAAISPIALAAGTTYWLSIVNDTAPAVADWLWASTTTDGRATFRDDPSDSWSSFEPQQAFELTDSGTAIPAPATALLLGLASAALAVTRRSAPPRPHA